MSQSILITKTKELLDKYPVHVREIVLGGEFKYDDLLLAGATIAEADKLMSTLTKYMMLNKGRYTSKMSTRPRKALINLYVTEMEEQLEKTQLIDNAKHFVYDILYHNCSVFDEPIELHILQAMVDNTTIWKQFMEAVKLTKVCTITGTQLIIPDETFLELEKYAKKEEW